MGRLSHWTFIVIYKYYYGNKYKLLLFNSNLHLGLATTVGL